MKRITQTFIVAGLVGALRLSGTETEEPSRGAVESIKQATEKSQTNIRGEVLRVEPGERRGHGVVLQVRTERGTIPVHLGPTWYLENQRLQVKAGDQVEVTGTRVIVQDKETLVASQVKKGEQVLKLRDESGRPIWAATGRGMGMEGLRTEQHQKIMEQHRKMVSQMKAMEAQLDKKVAEMNESEGQAKVNAMAEVLNQLVKERKAMRENMALMMHEGMGAGEQRAGEEEGIGSGAPGGDTEEEEKDHDPRTKE